MIRWPWTNLHELNLDWIIRKMKELEEKVVSYGTKVVGVTTTTGAAGSQANVTIDGDLDTGLNFDFTIPRGPQGPQGETGARGPAGANAILTSRTIDVDSSVTIEAGHYGTIRFPLTGIVNDADHVIAVKEYNLAGTDAEVSLVSVRITTQNDILYVFMDLFNPTSTASTLRNGDITISYFTD